MDPRWGNQARDKKALAIWQTLLHYCGDDVASGVWLDVGCGSGGISAALAPRVYQMIAVDPEPWQAWDQSAAAHGNLKFQIAVFDQQDAPPMADGSVDVVVCNQVYEHVNNPKMLLSNIHRVLRPGGCCYFAGPNLLWPIEPHVYWPVVHWLPRSAARRFMEVCGSRNADALDAYSASYWTLTSWFRESGFSFVNGFAVRLRIELELRGASRIATIIGSAPESLFVPVSPFLPGFIFLLRKQ